MNIMRKYLLTTAICRSPDESAVAEVIETAGEIAEDAIEAAEDAAEQAIEDAAEQIEAAEDAAETIARAAMMTELGKRVTETYERAEQWHVEQMREFENLRGMVQDQARQIEELRAQMTQPTTVVVTTPEPDQSSILPGSPEPDQTAVAVITPGANLPEPNGNIPAAPAKAAKRTRWI